MMNFTGDHMSYLGRTWAIALASLGLAGGGCSGQNQLVGSDGSKVAAAAGSSGSSGAPAGGGADNDGLSYTVYAQVNADNGKCLPEPLQPESHWLLLTMRSGAACSCSEPGLVPSPAGLTPKARDALQLAGQCGNQGQPACSEYCACEFPRAIGTSLIECKTQAQPSADSVGWCYVSADAGEPQTGLVADCPAVQQQRLRFMDNARLLADAVNFLAHVDSAPAAAPRRELGEVCSDGSARSVNVDETNIYTQSPVCGSGVCVANHFQGLVSCPYGQIAGAGECFLPGSTEAISRAVTPQLVERQAAIASICSCQCAGSGPGPYCTCPESMQCEHLIDDLGVGGEALAGSYCIPKGSAFNPDAPRTECVEPNCGVKHPY